MPNWCNLCGRSFLGNRAFEEHNRRYHKHPKPPPPRPSRFHYHPYLTGMYCYPTSILCPCSNCSLFPAFLALPFTQNGQFLPRGTPPLPKDDTHDWSPFDSRPHFEFTEWNFEKVQTSEGDLDHLLEILSAQKALDMGNPTAQSMYSNADEMLKTIDAIQQGDAPWLTFHLKYTGPITPSTPAWKLQTYVVYTRNPLRVAELIARSPDFKNSWDYVPYEEFTSGTCQRFSNLMSGRWAFKKAVSFSFHPPTVTLRVRESDV